MNKVTVLRRVPKTPAERIVEYFDTFDVAEIYLRAAEARMNSPHKEYVDGEDVYCAECGRLGPGSGDPIMHPERYLAGTLRRTT